jgi:predicted ATPase/DNA-binding SARP family transcriptional activator
MEVRVLGPLEVLGDDGRNLDVGGLRPRTLLVALALAGGRPVPAEQLLEDVWSGQRRPARNNLQVHVSRLRRAIGEERIASRGGSYALEIPADAVDAARFEHLMNQGRAALNANNAADASEFLREALQLWRGSALSDFTDREFARPVITRLEEERLAAIEDRIHADLMLGRHGQLVGELEALLQREPLRERLWCQLITALYRAGRQGDALRAYQRARRVLSDELGVSPGPELRRLESAVLEHDPALATPMTAESPRQWQGGGRIGNLPAASTELIGRDTELDVIGSMVRANRIVTIVGTGGVGKTRLAIEVGRSLLEEYGDGVWLVGLASVGDPAAVAPAFAAALGVDAEPGPGVTAGILGRVSDFLSRRQALIILDNCEHVILEAARAVEHLLGRCGQLRILTTSREALSIADESLWTLSPLPIHQASDLFTTRARALAPTFPSDEATLSAVEKICERLDGLPLAIELAAGRVRAFGTDDILTRLNDRFRFLTGGSRTALPRQQTLQAVVDWSYDLLFDDERKVFERMSVFAGPSDLGAAEQVCADETIPMADVAGVLGRLVDRSLLTAEQTEHGIRFRLLATLAEYGRQRLLASGGEEAVRRRHARWAASLIEVPDPFYASWNRAWFDMVNRSIDDIRLAMEWTLRTGDGDTALRIVSGIYWFWNTGGVTDDWWAWVTGAMALGQPATALRVRALAMAASVGGYRHPQEALSYGANAVELGRAVGDRRALALAELVQGAQLANFVEPGMQSAPLLEEAATLLEAEGDDWTLAMAALARGGAALAQGDVDRAESALRIAGERFARVGNHWTAALAFYEMADIACWRGGYDDAITALREAWSGLLAVEAVGMTSAFATRLGYLSTLQGRFREADAWHTQAMTLAEQQRDGLRLALVHNSMGLAFRAQNRLGEAEVSHRVALALYHERSSPLGAATALAWLGYLAELGGDETAAEGHHRASLDAAWEAGDRRAQARALEGLAGVASLRGDARTVGRLLGAAEALRGSTAVALLGVQSLLLNATGGRLSPAERVDVDRARARIDDQRTMDVAFADGEREPETVVADERSRSGAR